METVDVGRVAALVMMSQDMEAVKALSAKVDEKKRQLASFQEIRAKALEQSDAFIADATTQLSEAEAELLAAGLRLDGALSILYPLAPAAAEPEPKKRGKKTAAAQPVQAEPVAQTSVVGAAESGTAKAEASDEVKTTPCTACHAASHCDDCCKECLSGCDTKQACRKNTKEPEHEAVSQKTETETESAETPAPGDENDSAGASAEQVGCQKCEGEGWYTGDDGEVNCDCEAGKALTHYEQTELADVPETVPPVAAAVTFLPLTEPHGDCELCQGFGVVEGELYGEPQPVPCLCEAGIKVKGGVLPSPCDNCNIDDPDCASCHVPDMDAPFEVEEAELPPCANGACTATGKGAKEICLRIGTLGRAPKDCKNFVAVADCSHHMLKRSEVNGATVCDLCGFVLGTAEREAEIAGAAPEPNKLQTKCPHPKPFRVETPDGIMCKVCKTVIEPRLAA